MDVRVGPKRKLNTKELMFFLLLLFFIYFFFNFNFYFILLYNTVLVLPEKQNELSDFELSSVQSLSYV